MGGSSGAIRRNIIYNCANEVDMNDLGACQRLFLKAAGTVCSVVSAHLRIQQVPHPLARVLAKSIGLVN